MATTWTAALLFPQTFFRSTMESQALAASTLRQGDESNSLGRITGS